MMRISGAIIACAAVWLRELPAATRDGAATSLSGLTAVGATAPVVTMPPYLAMTQCITTSGVFPSLPQ
jgi:microcystin-dependent protein